MPVFCVRNGVPGRGLDVDAGVDISTGIYGAGEPCAFVTAMVATVIVGSGVKEDDGAGVGFDAVVPPQSTIAMARATAAAKMASALGMARTVRRLRQALR